MTSPLPKSGTAARPALGTTRAKLILLLAFLAFAAYVIVIFFRISAQAGLDETRRTDVIVIFGAAEYSGKPSPVYRARLDHGAELFIEGVAPVLITTGGAGGEAHFSEGQVGRDYLISRGVPDAQVIAETQSDDTLESAKRVATIMRENHMLSCVVVSDGYHMYRIKQMMEAQGVKAFASPRSDPHKHPMAAMEEVFKYLAWKVKLEI